MVLHYARAAPRYLYSRNKPLFFYKKSVFFAPAALRFEPFKTIERHTPRAIVEIIPPLAGSS